MAISQRWTAAATALCLLLSLSACNVTKHLDETKGERLLWKNTIELKAEKKLNIAARTPLLYELGGYVKQKPNRRAILQRFPIRLWLYHAFKDRAAKEKGHKLAKWIINKKAEAPVIYDPLLTQRTATNLERAMQKRGYFFANCVYETDTIGKHKIGVRYQLNLGKRFTIDSVFFHSRDSLVRQILYMTAGGSLLRRNEPLDEVLFNAEKVRITTELKNRGYAYFNPTFVQYNADTTGTRSNITVEVQTPSDSLMHQTYLISNIIIKEGVNPEIASFRQEATINGLYFVTADTFFVVKPERLAQAIALQPNWPYIQSNFDKTIRNLNGLGTYKFVSVKPRPDPNDPQKIMVEILLTPTNGFSWGGDFDFNNSISNSSVAGNLLGVSSSLNMQNRNIFGGAERLSSSVLYNLEFNVQQDNRFIFSQEFKFQNELRYPRFFDYMGLWNMVGGIKAKNKYLVPTRFQKNLESDGHARFAVNYNYLELFDFYRYHLVNLSFGYDLNTSQQHHYTFDHIGIDFLGPDTRSRFDTVFGKNPLFSESFKNQLFTGFILRNFSYALNTRTNAFGERWTFNIATDLSGLELYALNSLWSAIFGKETWTLGGFEFSKYLRTDVAGGYTRDFNKKLTGALRAGFGLVFPFGDTRVAPYVKQFFVGGPGSLRAWRIREIGPGGYYDPANANIRPYFQAADFRFEFNGELRFPIFWWLKGAIFLDGGNIWTLRDDGREGGQLGWDSYKDIALGAGFGFRFDFDYFVLRFDAGLPLRRPYQTEGEPWHWYPKRFEHIKLSSFTPNIAVGYPF